MAFADEQVNDGLDGEIIVNNNYACHFQSLPYMQIFVSQRVMHSWGDAPA